MVNSSINNAFSKEKKIRNLGAALPSPGVVDKVYNDDLDGISGNKFSPLRIFRITGIILLKNSEQVNHGLIDML
jgi:hypothetical protein